MKAERGQDHEALVHQATEQEFDKTCTKEYTTNYSSFLFTNKTKDILIVMLGLESLTRFQKIKRGTKTLNNIFLSLLKTDWLSSTS